MMMVVMVMNIEQGINIRSTFVSEQFSRSRRSFQKSSHIYIYGGRSLCFGDKATFATNLLLTHMCQLKGSFTANASPLPISLGSVINRLPT